MATALAGLAGVGAAPAAPTAGPVDDLRLVVEKRSLLGTHTWYQQTYRGLDVLGGTLTRHTYAAGTTSVTDEREPVSGAPGVVPQVARDRALAAAGRFARRADLAVLPGRPSRLVWAVRSEPPGGATRTLVAADDGSVIRVESLVRHADGSGTVFDPSPVVTLRDPSLTDQEDADYPALAPAYQSVTLRHLDGSGQLVGDFASVGANDPAYSPDLSFDYPRSSTYFSQTMAYYHLTAAQEYLQALGFADVNNEPQLILPDAFEEDSSFYQSGIPGLEPDLIVTGTGGVDDAEDADVLWHEYGHAIQDDQLPGFGASEDARAIGEGFGDYWAATLSQAVNDGYDEPCVADWDATAFRVPCLRRVDTDTTIADRTFEIHDDGQIWSRALWDINRALGRDAANLIIVEAQFGFARATTFDAAARVTVDTALRLFGGREARVVAQAFEDRGIDVTGHDLAVRPGPAPSAPGLHPIATLDSPTPGGGFLFIDFEPYDLNDSGQAEYGADVTTGGEALFLSSGDTVRELARSFTTAPDGGQFGFGVLPGTTTLDSAGELAFTFAGPPETFPRGLDARLYRTRRGSLSPVVVPDVTPAPGGGRFVGVNGSPTVDDRGTVAFAGMIRTDAGIEGELGVGIFAAAGSQAIRAVVVPGDPAPGGGRFDFADEPTLNGRGDLAFGGHLAGDPCDLGLPQNIAIGCERGLYLRDGSSGRMRRLASVGDAAPGGGTFVSLRGPVINASGDVLFRGLVDTGSSREPGFFLAHDGGVTAVARLGDAAPGGGRLTVLPFQPGNWDLNDRGDVSFSATLDTDDNEDGLVDMGLYRWSAGELSLVVRSGTALAGDAEILTLQPLEYIGLFDAPYSGALINNHRQTLFAAFVRTGAFHETVLYLASGTDPTAAPATATVGDLVWQDDDGDGIQDASEPRVPDVSVQLLGPGGELLRAVATDADGRYAFTEVAPGDYSVRFAPPRSYVFTPADRGADDLLDSDADPHTRRTPVFTLLPEERELSIDAGLRLAPRASIGGSTWLDSDRDGLQVKGQQLVGGVQVELLDAQGNLLASQVSDPQFGYLFPRLRAGEYRVRFTAPEGLALTTANVGTNDELDSDPDPATGLTPIIVLPDGRIDQSVDAGFIPS